MPVLISHHSTYYNFLISLHTEKSKHHIMSFFSLEAKERIQVKAGCGWYESAEILGARNLEAVWAHFLDFSPKTPVWAHFLGFSPKTPKTLIATNSEKTPLCTGLEKGNSSYWERDTEAWWDHSSLPPLRKGVLNYSPHPKIKVLLEKCKGSSVLRVPIAATNPKPSTTPDETNSNPILRA